MTPKPFDPINDPERLDKFVEDLEVWLQKVFKVNPKSRVTSAYVDGVYVELERKRNDP